MELLEKRRFIMPMVLLPQEPEEEPRSQAGLSVSLERYWQEYYNDPDFVYEWNNGYLEEKPMSKKETKKTFHWLEKVLAIYFEVYPIAEMYGLETGFKLKLPAKISIRRPALGIVKKDNPVPFKANTDNYEGIFDLCIEAISDSNKENIERDTIAKKEEYEEGSVSEYYILDGKGKNTRFYAMNEWGLYEQIEPIDGDIIVSQVLPGFQFRISDLYRQPKLEELVEDEVYQGYVMVKYQAERAEKERERKRAERERERAEKAEQEAQQAQQKAQQAQQKAQQAQSQLIAEQQEKERERLRAEQAEKELERLKALLRAQGISLD